MKKRILYLITFFCISFSSVYGQHSKINAFSKLSSSIIDSLFTPQEDFEYAIKRLYIDIQGREHDLNYSAFRYAYIGYQNMKIQNKLNDKRLLSIIDFTKESGEKRFYTIDLTSKQILYYTYVAHGKKTGMKAASYFSNKNDSNKSSLGFYVTGKTYKGDAGFSLKLYGDERNYNSNAYKRGIVIHTANYMNEDFLKKNGRYGRSLGCPVLPTAIYKQIIETIKEGTMIFAYYNNPKYLSSSKYLKISSLTESNYF
ncbi:MULTISPECIES: murein L,D-transpeptidase catalytic domain family protein [unclassified Capnocytophaga]|uniref:murein L,D-transpeptidase catalytic domain family protein n=1 Tax=unclassified Capnocytophaga TaxID=2640652 RepID=UPI000202D188|nr:MULTISPECIES: murein L,D-transpeptidase catalytic domain family protein [unclassified Capnocytophaga]EGD33825.1 twin-arginine translocation pathway signal [Capnocytophaga sp. oral taxon 338 str. F0234]MEB3004946.1 murein L,D-transpeptidase catalytic domain family protein [Capnocytophaga sp. G2]